MNPFGCPGAHMMEHWNGGVWTMRCYRLAYIVPYLLLMPFIIVALVLVAGCMPCFLLMMKDQSEEDYEEWGPRYLIDSAMDVLTVIAILITMCLLGPPCLVVACVTCPLWWPLKACFCPDWNPIGELCED